MIEITIVIVTYNAPAKLKRCLQSVYERRNEQDFKLLVLNNGEKKTVSPITAAFKKQKNIETIHCERNTGFCGAANIALSSMESPYVVFLDDDTIVSPRWLSHLYKTIRVNPIVGVVGGKIVFPDGKLFSAETEICSSGPISVGYGENDVGQRDYVREVDAVIGTCQIFRTEALKQVGGFDPAYFPNQLEDTDICLKLRVAGYKVWYTGLSTVVHDNLYRSGANSERNLEYFRLKWLTEQRSTYLSQDYKNENGRDDISFGEITLITDHEECTEAELANTVRGHLQSLAIETRHLNDNELWAGKDLDKKSIYIIGVSEKKLFNAISYIDQKANSSKIIVLVSDPNIASPLIKNSPRINEIWCFDHRSSQQLTVTPILRYIDSANKNSTRKALEVALNRPIKLRKESDTHLGVNIVGFTKGVMGVGEGARSMARCLRAAKIPFCIYSLKGGCFENSEDELLEYETDVARYPFTLIMSPVFEYNHILPGIDQSFYSDKKLIAYLPWELEWIPKTWAGPLTFVDALWGISSFVRKSLEKFTGRKHFTALHGIEVPQKISYSRQDLSLKKDAFIFLTMFDYNSLPERKNPDGVVRAFQTAFKADNPNVQLIVKTNNSHPHHPFFRKLQRMTKGWPNITIINETYTSDKIWSLLKAADCIVSLHRAEGFGLVCAEGMMLGKPVIATAWSGNMDFMNARNSCLIPFRKVAIKKKLEKYKRGAIWAEPSIPTAARWMKKLAGDPKLAATIGKAAKKSAKKSLSVKTIGKVVKAELMKMHRMKNKRTSHRSS